MNKRPPTYIVYSYQYVEMTRPRIDAIRRVHHDERDMDSLPPTVMRWTNVGAVNKREAIQIGRDILERQS